MELEDSKITIFEKFSIVQWERRYFLGPNNAKKHLLYQKMLQTKIIIFKFLTKNSVDCCISLSFPVVQLGGGKHLPFFIVDYCIVAVSKRLMTSVGLWNEQRVEQRSSHFAHSPTLYITLFYCILVQ